MVVKQFYLVRHGETDYNKTGIIQGRSVDSDLNELGRQQAALFFERYKQVAFSKIYTSSLKRTLQSVDAFRQLGLPWEAHADLDELSWGIYDGRYPNPLLRPGMKRIISKWDKGMGHVKAFRGESPVEVTERLHRWLLLALSRPHEEQILVATHGRALRLLLCDMFGLPIEKMSEFGHANMCLYRVDYSYGTQRFDLVSQNDTNHLNGLGL